MMVKLSCRTEMLTVGRPEILANRAIHHHHPDPARETTAAPRRRRLMRLPPIDTPEQVLHRLGCRWSVILRKTINGSNSALVLAGRHVGMSDSTPKHQTSSQQKLKGCAVRLTPGYMQILELVVIMDLIILIFIIFLFIAVGALHVLILILPVESWVRQI